MKWILRESVWLLESKDGKYIAILYSDGFVRYAGADGQECATRFDTDTSVEGRKMAVEMLV